MSVNLEDYSDILLDVKEIISSKVHFFPFLFFFFLVKLNKVHFMAPAMAGSFSRS